MKSIEKMRESLRVCGCDPAECTGCGVPRKVREIADEIEAEIEAEYMRLLVDADGVPIRIGDMVESRDWCEPRKVDCYLIGCRTSDGGRVWHSACELTHVKPRTLEDVLGEFASKQHGITAEENESLIAECAAEIRELLGGDA